MKIAFDLDGVLCNPAEYIKKYLMGEKKDWKSYFTHTLEFPLINTMVAVYRVLAANRRNVIYLITGRPESNRDLTKAWIWNNGLPFLYGFGGPDTRQVNLLMRKDGDQREAADVKLEMLQEITPNIVFEDDPVACEKMSAAGYLVLQVHGYRCKEDTTDRIPE